MSILGLDVGTLRIGVALSDETGLIAQPLTSLEAGGSLDTVIDRIVEHCNEHNVETIVVGMPLSLSGGSRGQSAMRAREIGTRLEAGLNVSVVYWDERFTTAQAERVLIDARVSRAKRRKIIDKVAASLILQSYLDSRGRDEL